MSNFMNILSVSMKSIMKNKRRNIFTMIGIVIGIAAVITIMSLGEGFKQSSQKEFESSGASKDSALIMYNTMDQGKGSNPFDEQTQQVAKQVEGVKDVKIKENDQEGYSAKMTNPQKQGDITIKKKDNLKKTEKGEGFSKEDNELFKKVVTVDTSLAEDAFNGDAIGKNLFIDGQGFKIVGVTAKDQMAENGVNMPKKTFDRYLPNLQQNTSQLEVKIKDGSEKKEVAKKVEEELNKKGAGAGSGQYSFTDMQQMMKQFNKIFDSITAFVAAVAGISLFIAGIGVMNVMYISVAERTEEIAIRRAFGAKARDIELQFLVESIVLCLIGGIIGLILGIIFAKLVEVLTPEFIKSAVTLTSVLIAVGVSTLIGIVFGWIPARAAAKKELIDIIK
ncbi:ABC transporter permease [Staphylococcus massiliensis]|uniref:ABC transporter permease n=1 Tax=Staphylococcus massiliensis TaxID=555791 RepID=UPI0002E3903F|nr:ABC transporter permease [Staphylococcus massiliensis]MCG3399185.1 ABC transporter permease [Staphylococcus massiliensis]MCG3402237.1 ABC transporter permease [Staphylococcus massiliensis]MCG3412795.1 ABC transporter permease [Staphylococcus massiliensis]POA00732.1 ABC transporter permease [Staphylococcus massiliensis CCUG 55927]